MQVPRDLNTQANALANLGSSLIDVSLTSIPHIHLTALAISKCKDVTDVAAAIGNADADQTIDNDDSANDNADKNNDIPANDEVSVSWMKPIYDYLTSDVLP